MACIWNRNKCGVAPLGGFTVGTALNAFTRFFRRHLRLRSIPGTNGDLVSRLDETVCESHSQFAAAAKYCDFHNAIRLILNRRLLFCLSRFVDRRIDGMQRQQDLQWMAA